MMLRQIARQVRRRAPNWDPSVRIAFVLALALLILLLGLGFAGPPPLQMPARIGAFGLLITLQLLFLWGSRRDISPYHQAQRHFIDGDYEAARAILARLPDDGRESVDALTLLGNACRHLGLFQQSRQALRRALDLKPRHHLALFSYGKLLLAQGECAAAAAQVRASLEAGAPDLVRFELGQCCFLLGDTQTAREQFLAARSHLDDMPAQLAMADVYLWQLDGASDAKPAMADELRQYWRDEAQKYAATPYGAHLREMLGEG